MSSFVLNARPLLYLLAFLLAGCFREKDLLDAEVRKLCAQDGGVKVYETEKVPKELFNEFGEVLVRPVEKASSTDKYAYLAGIKYLQKGNPEMSRTHFQIIRRHDGKVLAESVSYMRYGGDFLRLGGPESSFRCPRNVDIKYMARQVFEIR